MKPIVIITGANGFLGNHLVRYYEHLADVRALILPGTSKVPLQGVRCTIYEGDVTKPDSLKDLFTLPPDRECLVIHCAAIVSIRTGNRRPMQEVNIEGVRTILKMTLAAHAKLLYVSSVHAIPERPAPQVITEVSSFDPKLVRGAYAKTKATAADLVLRAVREEGLWACIVHPSGMLGPGDYGRSHLTQLVVDTLNGRLVAGVSGGYDFVDVRDVTKGIALAAKKGNPGDCYLLTGHACTVPDLLNEITRTVQLKPVKSRIPLWFAKLTAPFAEGYYLLLRQPPLYTSYSLYTLSSNHRFSCEKAKQNLGYRPRPLEETVRDTVVWLLKQGRIRPSRAAKCILPKQKKET